MGLHVVATMEFGTPELTAIYVGLVRLLADCTSNNQFNEADILQMLNTTHETLIEMAKTYGSEAGFSQECIDQHIAASERSHQQNIIFATKRAGYDTTQH